MSTDHYYSQLEYFFYGHPAAYGLVGVHDRRIWLVLCDEKLAHQIKNAFSSKISLIVFDLRTFSNYHPTLLDNRVCLQWSIPVEEYINLGIVKTIVSPSFENTYTASTNAEISNTVPHFNFLYESVQIDLQHQLMFYHYLLESVLQTVNTDETTELDKAFDQAINLVFATELTLPPIKHKLTELANTQLGSQNLTPLIRYKAARILQTFNKVYG